MARQRRKQQKRLEARIKGWEAGKGSNVSDRIKEHEVSGSHMHKPGSNKK